MYNHIEGFYFLLLFFGYFSLITFGIVLLIRDSKTLHLLTATFVLICIGCLCFLFNFDSTNVALKDSHMRFIVNALNDFNKQLILLFPTQDKSNDFFEYLLNGLNTVWLVIGFHITGVMKEEFSKYPAHNTTLMANSKDYQNEFVKLLVFIILVNYLFGALIKSQFTYIPAMALSVPIIILNIYFMHNSFDNIEMVKKYGNQFELVPLNFKILTQNFTIIVISLIGLVVAYHVRKPWFGTYFALPLLIIIFFCCVEIRYHYTLQKMRSFKIPDSEWRKHIRRFRDREQEVNKSFYPMCIIASLPTIVGIFYLLVTYIISILS